MNFHHYENMPSRSYVTSPDSLPQKQSPYLTNSFGHFGEFIWKNPVFVSL